MDIKSLPADVKTHLRSGIKINNISQCVNELVLNSLDAKSTAIAIRINLLTFRIQIVDNGEGMCKNNLHLVGIRYMTSKCHTIQDYQRRLKFYGFRGETLASIINNCKQINFTSRVSNTDDTYCKNIIENQPDSITSVKHRPSVGTTITIEDFLYNLPVRQKRVNNELDLDDIKKNLECLAIIHPQVVFSLRNDINKKMVFKSIKTATVENAFVNLFPEIQAGFFKEIKITKDKYSVLGLIHKNMHVNNKLQFIYVNKRPIVHSKIQKFINNILSNSTIANLTKKACDYFIYVINIKCPYSEIDLTVHPEKNLIEFKQWDIVYKCIEKVVMNFLEKENLLNKIVKKQTDKKVVHKIRSQFHLSDIDGTYKAIANKRKLSQSQKSSILSNHKKQQTPKNCSNKAKNEPKKVENKPGLKFYDLNFPSTKKTKQKSKNVKNSEKKLETHILFDTKKMFEGLAPKQSSIASPKFGLMSPQILDVSHRTNKLLNFEMISPSDTSALQNIQSANSILTLSDHPIREVTTTKERKVPKKKFETLLIETKDLIDTRDLTESGIKAKSYRNEKHRARSRRVGLSKSDIGIISSIHSSDIDNETYGKALVMKKFLESTEKYEFEAEPDSVIIPSDLTFNTSSNIKTHHKSSNRRNINNRKKRVNRRKLINSTLYEEEIFMVNEKSIKMVSKCVQTTIQVDKSSYQSDVIAGQVSKCLQTTLIDETHAFRLQPNLCNENIGSKNVETARDKQPLFTNKSQDCRLDFKPHFYENQLFEYNKKIIKDINITETQRNHLNCNQKESLCDDLTTSRFFNKKSKVLNFTEDCDYNEKRFENHFEEDLNPYLENTPPGSHNINNENIHFANQEPFCDKLVANCFDNNNETQFEHQFTEHFDQYNYNSFDEENFVQNGCERNQHFGDQMASNYIENKNKINFEEIPNHEIFYEEAENQHLERPNITDKKQFGDHLVNYVKNNKKTQFEEVPIRENYYEEAENQRFECPNFTSNNQFGDYLATNYFENNDKIQFEEVPNGEKFYEETKNQHFDRPDFTNRKHFDNHLASNYFENNNEKQFEVNRNREKCYKETEKQHFERSNFTNKQQVGGRLASNYFENNNEKQFEEIRNREKCYKETKNQHFERPNYTNKQKLGDHLASNYFENNNENQFEEIQNREKCYEETENQHFERSNFTNKQQVGGHLASNYFENNNEKQFEEIRNREKCCEETENQHFKRPDYTNKQKLGDHFASNYFENNNENHFEEIQNREKCYEETENQHFTNKQKVGDHLTSNCFENNIEKQFEGNRNREKCYEENENQHFERPNFTNKQKIGDHLASNYFKNNNEIQFEEIPNSKCYEDAINHRQYFEDPNFDYNRNKKSILIDDTFREDYVDEYNTNTKVKDNLFPQNNLYFADEKSDNKTRFISKPTNPFTNPTNITENKKQFIIPRKNERFNINIPTHIPNNQMFTNINHNYESWFPNEDTLPIFNLNKQFKPSMTFDCSKVFPTFDSHQHISLYANNSFENRLNLVPNHLQMLDNGKQTINQKESNAKKNIYGTNYEEHYENKQHTKIDGFKYWEPQINQQFTNKGDKLNQNLNFSTRKCNHKNLLEERNKICHHECIQKHQSKIEERGRKRKYTELRNPRKRDIKKNIEYQNVFRKHKSDTKVYQNPKHPATYKNIKSDNYLDKNNRHINQQLKKNFDDGLEMYLNERNDNRNNKVGFEECKANKNYRFSKTKKTDNNDGINLFHKPIISFGEQNIIKDSNGSREMINTNKKLSVHKNYGIKLHTKQVFEEFMNDKQEVGQNVPAFIPERNDSFSLQNQKFKKHLKEKPKSAINIISNIIIKPKKCVEPLLKKKEYTESISSQNQSLALSNQSKKIFPRKISPRIPALNLNCLNLESVHVHPISPKYIVHKATQLHTADIQQICLENIPEVVYNKPKSIPISLIQQSTLINKQKLTGNIFESNISNFTFSLNPKVKTCNPINEVVEASKLNIANLKEYPNMSSDLIITLSEKEQKQRIELNDLVSESFIINLLSEENVEEDANEFVKKIDSEGNRFYINTRTGMTTYVSPTHLVDFELKKRIDFVPKGLSPILVDSNIIHESMSASAKKSLYEVLMQTYADELETIKWKKCIQNIDPKVFFDRLYKERAQKDIGIPDITKCKFSRAVIKSYNVLNSITFNKDIFKNLKVIGQLDNKFIVAVAKMNTLVVLFDQHAVDERIRVEKLYKLYQHQTDDNSIKYKSTLLENDVIIDLSDNEVSIFTRYVETFEDIGLHYRIISNKIIFNKVPTCLFNKAKKDKDKMKMEKLIKCLIKEEVETIRNTRGVPSRNPKIIQNIINSEACRSSVMFGDPLTINECSEYINELSACILPFQCAHGRPTLAPIIELHKQEREVSKINLRKLLRK